VSYHRPLQRSRQLLNSRKPWKFPLVGEFREEGRTKYFRYTPKSDFHFSIDGFPWIILEVISDASQELDRYRMLIQASCIARLANAMRPGKFPFVVMAIYFDQTSFERYLVYQPDVSSTSVLNKVLLFLQRLCTQSTDVLSQADVYHR
jgi:hypothetical protein